jgi:hypothetical protein
MVVMGVTTFPHVRMSNKAWRVHPTPRAACSSHSHHRAVLVSSGVI